MPTPINRFFALLDRLPIQKSVMPKSKHLLCCATMLKYYYYDYKIKSCVILNARFIIGYSALRSPLVVQRSEKSKRHFQEEKSLFTRFKHIRRGEPSVSREGVL